MESGSLGRVADTQVLAAQFDSLMQTCGKNNTSEHIGVAIDDSTTVATELPTGRANFPLLFLLSKATISGPVMAIVQTSAAEEHQRARRLPLLNARQLRGR